MPLPFSSKLKTDEKPCRKPRCGRPISISYKVCKIIPDIFSVKYYKLVDIVVHVL